MITKLIYVFIMFIAFFGGFIHVLERVQVISLLFSDDGSMPMLLFLGKSSL